MNPLNWHQLDPGGVADGDYTLTVAGGDITGLSPASPGGGSGVVETIVPGTGIAVDDADPANPVVSATGPGGAAVASFARVGKSAAQPIPTGAFTSVTWQTEGSDTDSYHSTATNTDRLTVPSAGVYVVTANPYLSYVSGTTTGERVAMIYKNGTPVARSEGTSAGSHAENLTSGPIACAAGDYFTLSVYIDAGSWQVDATLSFFAIHRLGD